MFSELLDDEDGQGMVEYALVIGLIALAVIVALGVVGGILSQKFDEYNEKISNIPGIGG